MLDHILWGVPDLDRGIREIAEHTGVRAQAGGRHPGVGTHNALLDLTAGRYFEIIAPDPTQDRFSGFGLLLRDLDEPGLLTWAARTDDLEAVAAGARNAGLEPGEIVAMTRRRPDGEILEWRLMRISGHPWGPLLPFFIEWKGRNHPSRDAPRGCRLQSFVLEHPAAAELRALLLQLGLDAETRERPNPRMAAIVTSSHSNLGFYGSG